MRCWMLGLGGWVGGSVGWWVGGCFYLFGVPFVEVPALHYGVLCVR